MVDIGGHRLHLWCQGEGTPVVVFDSALGASSLSWSLVVDGVAAVTRACRYDRAGFGWSERGPLPRTAGRIADELHDLLRLAGVPVPRLLVGHSYGGLVMRLLASRHPHDVAGLVLIEPAHPEAWEQPSEEQRRQIARGTRLCRYGAQAARLGVGRVISALVSAGAIGTARAIVKVVSRGSLGRADESILAPVWKLPPETRPFLKQLWTQPRFFEALGSQIASICESARQAAHEVPSHYGDLPLVVVTRADAQKERTRADAALAQRSTRGRHVIAANSSHWIPLDAPDVVVGAIVDVIREVRVSRSA